MSIIMVDFIISRELSETADNSRISEKLKWSRLLDKSDTNVSELKFFIKRKKYSLEALIFIGWFMEQKTA